MALYVWPFLIGRGRSLGINTIVAPDFLVSSGGADLLPLKIGGEARLEPLCVPFLHSMLGSLTVCYHVVPAMGDDGAYRDGFGREIEWIEGIILQGEQLPFEVPDEIFREACELARKHYPAYWVATTRPEVVPSAPLEISTTYDGLASEFEQADRRREPESKAQGTASKGEAAGEVEQVTQKGRPPLHDNPEGRQAATIKPTHITVSKTNRPRPSRKGCKQSVGGATMLAVIVTLVAMTAIVLPRATQGRNQGWSNELSGNNVQS